MKETYGHAVSKLKTNNSLCLPMGQMRKGKFLLGWNHPTGSQSGEAWKCTLLKWGSSHQLRLTYRIKLNEYFINGRPTKLPTLIHIANYRNSLSSIPHEALT